MASRFVSTVVCVDDIWNKYGYTVSIANDGRVYSFGKHLNGAHGHKEADVFPPKRINSLTNIQSVSCFQGHTMCLDYDGNVFIFGSNEGGSLGIGKRQDKLKYSYKPRKLDLPPIKQVSCGSDFSICLSQEGNLYSFGSNSHGQLGHGTFGNANVPVLIETLNNVDFVECGYSFAICKTLNNLIYSWGYNHYGQLGKLKSSRAPEKCTNWPDNVVDIKCGESHTLILTSNMEVYSCGSNMLCQLGREVDRRSFSVEKIEDLPEIIRIECGNWHSMCLDINYNLYIFGYNTFGQLGLNDKDNRVLPIQHSLSNIIDISSKGNHTFVKTSDNEIYGFGRNSHSQLGINTEEKQLSPVKILEGAEYIWCRNMKNKSMAKSARK